MSNRMSAPSTELTSTLDLAGAETGGGGDGGACRSTRTGRRRVRRSRCRTTTVKRLTPGRSLSVTWKRPLLTSARLPRTVTFAPRVTRPRSVTVSEVVTRGSARKDSRASRFLTGFGAGEAAVVVAVTGAVVELADLSSEVPPQPTKTTRTEMAIARRTGPIIPSAVPARQPPGRFASDATSEFRSRGIHASLRRCRDR